MSPEEAGGGGGPCLESLMGDSVLISGPCGRLPSGHGAPSGAGVPWVLARMGLPAPCVLGAPCQRQGRRQLGAGIWPLVLRHRWGPLYAALGFRGAPCLLQAPERPGDP